MSFEFFSHIPNASVASPLIVRAPCAIEKPSFPCLSCNGTGKWVSPRGRVSGSCFACGGKGSHVKSHRDVMAAKAKRKATTEVNKQTRRHDFQEANPELFKFMAECQWSDFIRDMFAIVAEGRTLSEKQLAACVATKAKSDARMAARKAQRLADAPSVDFSKIEAMFAKAKAKGLTKLVYRADGLVLKPAKANSANPGAIYVTDKAADTYLGKVIGGKFICTREATDDHKATVNKIAADPSKAATDFGKRTGTCCCCGRELTDPKSIAAGIGPVCAEGWGL